MSFDPAWLSTSRVSANCRSKLTLPGVLKCWLTENPTVGNALSFYRPGVTGTWTDWPDEWWQTLAHQFTRMVKWYGTGMPEPHPVAFPTPLPKDMPGDPQIGCGLVMTEARASHVHLSHVANTLALEVTGFLPWSIVPYPYLTMRQLLNWNEYLQYRDSTSAQHPGYYFMGSSSPATPAFVARFLKHHDLIGTDALDTVARLFAWCRILWHYFVEGSATHPDSTLFWGPEAPPIPVSSLIKGTTYTGPSGPKQGHFTAGCGGTTDFFKAVLRVVNIPVEVRYEPSQHTMPFFPTIDRALSHGDDPYNTMGLVTPFPGYPVPAPAEFLITGATWDQWFAPNLDMTFTNQHVGRRTAEIGVQYLSDVLMQAYRDDVASGADITAGRLAYVLAPYYTPATLDFQSLWNKLAAKAAATGFGA